MARLRFGAWVGSVVACWLVLGGLAGAQTLPAGDAPFVFGSAAFDIPPLTRINATPPRAVEMLAQALAAKPVLPRRVELVQDLGLCQLPSAVAPVIKAMSDPDAAVRIEAARSAAVLGDKSALGSLRELVADGDAAVRVAAIRAGAALKDRSFVAVGLKDSDETVFASACALATTPEHAAQIAARLPVVSAPARLMAIRSLGRPSAGAHAPLVAGQLASADLPQALAAIDSLAKMRATSQLAAVRKLLDHAHPTVRRASVAAMSDLAGADEQIAIARRMLADPDLSVRQAAAQLLAAHPSADAVPLLVQQLSAGYRPLHQAARQALVSAASVPLPPAVNAATKLLDDPDPRRRQDGSFVLGRIKSSAALERHIKLLSDQDWNVVSQAAESLGLIGRSEAAAELARVAALAGQGDDLKGMNEAEMQAIGNALLSCGRLRYKPALEVAKPLVPKKMTCPVIIRGPAIWAAGVLGDADDRQLAGQFLSIYKDNSPFEVQDARFESIKAIGNMRYTPALEEMSQQGRENALADLRWMAHAVADRLAGGPPTPYTPPSVSEVAETSIRSIEQ